MNKLFIKNSINKAHLLKALVEWFQAVTNMLLLLKNAHPGAYLGATAQSKIVQNRR